MADEGIVERVALRVRELEQQLDAFSDRLRAMRRRNRELEEEIEAFEREIIHLREWLQAQRDSQ